MWCHLALTTEWSDKFSPTYDIDIHTKFNGDLICRFDVMISALLQDYQN